MDFNSTVDLIIKDLNEALKIIDDFKNYPEVPLFQVELAKSKCKSAAEIISLIRDLQKNIEPTGKNELSSDTPEIKKESFRKTTREPAFYTPQTIQAADKTAAKPQEKKPDSEILAETFNDQKGSIYEQLGSLKSDDGILDIIQNKPITNLSEAIGVNDRFLFMKEIFRGDYAAYDKAIERLDGATTLTDAESIINDYTSNIPETEAARRLLDIVKRKFPVNE